MRPGDVLVHDVMLVHGSQPTLGNALRRTIYYEFRPAEQILEEGPWDRAWVDKRLRLLPPAFEAYAEANPGQPGFKWRADPGFRPPLAGLPGAEGLSCGCRTSCTARALTAAQETCQVPA